MVSHSGLITVMTRAVRKAAPRLRRDYNEVEQLQVSKKGPADFVSMADKRAELRWSIAAQCPPEGMLVERLVRLMAIRPSHGGSRSPRRPTNFLNGFRTFPSRAQSKNRYPAGIPASAMVWSIKR